MSGASRHATVTDGTAVKATVSSGEYEQHVLQPVLPWGSLVTVRASFYPASIFRIQIKI